MPWKQRLRTTHHPPCRPPRALARRGPCATSPRGPPRAAATAPRLPFCALRGHPSRLLQAGLSALRSNTFARARSLSNSALWSCRPPLLGGPCLGLPLGPLAPKLRGGVGSHCWRGLRQQWHFRQGALALNDRRLRRASPGSPHRLPLVLIPALEKFCRPRGGAGRRRCDLKLSALPRQSRIGNGRDSPWSSAQAGCSGACGRECAKPRSCSASRPPPPWPPRSSRGHNPGAHCWRSGA
mmetsp:Transcript_76385/g.163814  ORF Transcript_76385/g.163814 Transcript_76385/m.163814 type:complete len:239 (+) Transcript_76385:628-1344(+)